MRTVQICDLFDVGYGTKFDLNKMRPLARKDGGVSFVGRSGRNNGVTSEVAPVDGTPPFPVGLISLALGGAILSAFVQPTPFYTAQNVAVLTPRVPMTLYQKLYVCQAIAANKVRYSAFGREANRTFRTLEIPHPHDAPEWVEREAHESYRDLQKPLLHTPPSPKILGSLRPHVLGDLFDVRKGKRLTRPRRLPGSVPFVGASDRDNGTTDRIGQEPIHDGGTISVAYNGSVAEAFYQPLPYWACDDVNVLYPRFVMPPEVGLFIATVIRQEKYRFSYGRKWHLERMRDAHISLPTAPDGDLDVAGIITFMRSLPFSSVLKDLPEV